jgi:hypothetical protein
MGREKVRAKHRDLLRETVGFFATCARNYLTPNMLRWFLAFSGRFLIRPARWLPKVSQGHAK